MQSGYARCRNVRDAGDGKRAGCYLRRVERRDARVCERPRRGLRRVERGDTRVAAGSPLTAAYGSAD